MTRKRSKSRWLWGIGFLILIVGAIAMVVLIKNNFFGDKPKDDNSQTSSDTVQQKDDKKEEKTTENEESAKKEEVVQYAGDNPNTAETLSGVISYADVSGEDLIIRVNINQFLTSGNCNLTMIKNGANIYSKSVGILESVSTSTCDGFKIPVTELTTGDLQIEIMLDSEGKSGKIVGKVRI